MEALINKHRDIKSLHCSDSFKWSNIISMTLNSRIVFVMMGNVFQPLDKRATFMFKCSFPVFLNVLIHVLNCVLSVFWHPSWHKIHGFGKFRFKLSFSHWQRVAVYKIFSRQLLTFSFLGRHFKLKIINANRSYQLSLMKVNPEWLVDRPKF